ncbi:MAG: DUF1573 domain-containing protein [Planctomycetes bacterium]|nr:DUF1573 domain-containing protein [Planctomycetota bacterium]
MEPKSLLFKLSGWLAAAAAASPFLLTNAAAQQPPIQIIAPASRPADPNAPHIRVDPAEVDFGEVEEGRVLEKDISFSNIGKEPLRITVMMPSCGCLGALATVDGQPYTLGGPIPPNAKGNLHIKHTTDGFGGIEKSVTLKLNTNDPSISYGIFSVKTHVKVRPIFGFEPKDRILRFDPLEHGAASPVRSFTISHTDGKAFQIKSIEPKVSWLEITTESADASAAKWKINISILPSAPYGTFTRQIKVSTDPEFAPPAWLTIYGDVRGPVMVAPASVQYLVLTKGQPSAKTCNVYVAKGLNIKFDKLQFFEAPDGSASLHPLAPEIAKHLSAQLNPGSNGTWLFEVKVDDQMPAGSFKAIASFDTGIPAASPDGSTEIRIPISGFIK